MCSLPMRANKLETVLSRDRLACLAPPHMLFFMYVIACVVYKQMPVHYY